MAPTSEPFCKVTAIVRCERLEAVELAVAGAGGSGVTVTRVRGHGDVKDFFQADWMVSHVRIEVFARAERADDLVQAITGAAHSGQPGDGLIAVLPVRSVHHIGERRPYTPDEL